MEFELDWLAAPVGNVGSFFVLVECVHTDSREIVAYCLGRQVIARLEYSPTEIGLYIFQAPILVHEYSSLGHSARAP